MRFIAIAAMSLVLAFAPGVRAEEAREVRIGQQYGFFYLPLIVMKERRLLEQHAVQLGLPEPTVSYTRLASGAPLNDALIAGTLDLAAAGTSPVITIWSRTQRNLRVHALAALGDVPIYLTTNRQGLHNLHDIAPADRIALPAVSVSLQAVVLEMAAAAAFGPNEWRRLDAQTVSLAHPDALVALISRGSEITAHFANPPFQDIELQKPGISRVLSSYDVLGGPHASALLYGTARFHNANPRTMQAVLAALRDADAFIAAQPRATAEIYLRAEPAALDVEAMTTLIRNPAMRFTITPERVLAFAVFQAKIGQIPEAPADWRALFFPEVHDEPGS